MTLSVTHTKVSAIADDPTASAAGEVLPSDWNAAHTLSGGTAASVLFNGTTTTPASLRQVATRCYSYFVRTLGAGNCNVQSYHFARDNITSLQIGWPGFYGADTANTGTNTLTAAVWYNGVAYQLKFSASTSGTIPNGGWLISDAVSVTIPAGAKFYIRSYQTFSVARLSRSPYTNTRDVTNGDAVNLTAADQTMTGTVPDAGTNIAGQWPVVILGSSSLPAVLLIGDSRLVCDGIGDSYTDGVGFVSYIERSIAPYFAETNLGLDGDTAANFATRTVTNSIFQYFTHVICEHGINDINTDGASAATVLTRLQAVYAMFTNGQKIYQTTLDPLSSSTDSWATTANQTTNANNAVRVSVNTSVRAGLANVANYFDPCSVTESSLNSGKWSVTGGAYTFDGIHGNVFANATVANAPVITQGTITGTSVFLNQDTRFTYSPASRNLTVGSVRLTNPGLANAGSALFLDSAGNIDVDVGNYTWTESTNILYAANVQVPAGGYYYYTLNGTALAALYGVYNATGNNWFVGHAGNATVSGSNNFGGGEAALYNLTSGINNVALGHFAGHDLLTGQANIAVGSNAFITAQASSNCFALGTSALSSYNDYGSVIGIGSEVFLNLASGGNSVGIGSYVAQAATAGSGLTLVGPQVAQNWGSGDFNTALGYAAGYNVTSGSNNTLLGCWQGPSAAMSNVIALSDGAGTVYLDYAYTNAATWTTPKAIMVTPVAVASLPTAGIAGRRHFVTDATATTFASVVAGTGANKVPVYDDGTNWRIG